MKMRCELKERKKCLLCGSAGSLHDGKLETGGRHASTKYVIHCINITIIFTMPKTAFGQPTLGWKPLTFVCRLEMRPKYPIGPVFLQQKKLPSYDQIFVWLMYGIYILSQNLPKMAITAISSGQTNLQCRFYTRLYATTDQMIKTEI